MAESLWGTEFEIEDTPQQVKKIVSKIAKPKKIDWSLPAEKLIKSKNTTIEQKLQIIDTNTLRILGVYKDNTLVIRNKDQLVEYIDKAIENDILAIDTETNMSLDPLTCTLMGPCIYTPGMKQAYIPLNHVNYQTGERLPNQLTEQDIKEQFDRLNQAKTKVFTHNGTFDFEVLKCTTGYEMEIYWDTFIGSMLLDENEKSHGLKQQYISKIDPSIEKYSIDHLFGAVPYEYIDPDIFALYAATDAYMTYKLYLYQKEQFEQPGMERLYKLFQEVEIPLMRVVAQIELTGVEIDQEYAKRLGYKYHQMSDSIETRIAEELKKYDDKIAEWRKTPEANYHPTTQRKNPKTGLKEDAPGKSKNELLEDPVSLKSPIQLAILLYDVLKVPPVNKEKPRGTGEDELKAIDLPLCKLMLEKRGLDKLIEVFIDKLPASVSEVDHRLHAHFNQLGTSTGRFSSTNPNLQQIPSHNREIRMLFKAAEGKVFVGGDFSQQEPRLLSSYSQDENMLKAYAEGKDLYATVAAIVHNNDYWDNMEHYEDGSPNPEGKKRRQDIKSVVLGILYGRGAPSVAEQIHTTTEEAQALIDKFFAGFPKVQEWVNQSREYARKYGYVEDMWGRRRHLPDIQLPRYEVKMSEAQEAAFTTHQFNPILGCKDRVEHRENPLVAQYTELANQCKGRKDVEALQQRAKQEGIIIQNNSGFISQAERQTVNSRVQGGAATMTKKALIKIHNDPELKSYQFQPLILVHDEIIGECLEQYADQAAARLSEIMRHAAEPECTVKFKCDITSTKVWYEEEYYNDLQEEIDNLRKELPSEEEVKREILARHIEITEKDLLDHIKFDLPAA